MPRITIRLPDALFAAVRQRARETGRSLSEFACDALRNELRRPFLSTHVSAPLPTYRGEGLRPGVDLVNGSGLEGIMRDC